MVLEARLPTDLGTKIPVLDAVDGTHRVHQCITRSKGVVYVRNFGCMCMGCVGGKYEECINTLYSERPVRQEVEPKSIAARSVTRQARVEGGGSMVAMCEVGDVVALACDDEDYSYYLASIQEGVHTVGRSGQTICLRFCLRLRCCLCLRRRQ